MIGLVVKTNFIYFNVTLGNKFELLIGPPKYGVHLTNIDQISLKTEENRYYMLVSLKNLSLINFFELKLKINPILSDKNSIFFCK